MEAASPRRTPAEWESPACLWLAWPHNRQTWPGNFRPLPRFFASWAHQVAESTPVRVLAGGELARSAARLLGTTRHIELVDLATDDCWIRDYGPTFVIDPNTVKLGGVAWRYNAWGGKYPPWDQDNAAATGICRHLGIPVVESELCLEGGAIEIDGGGRLLTTPDCLVTKTRNPRWTTPEIEAELRRQLGVTEIVWITGGGLEGDDTDGHIDQLARFIDRHHLVAAVCDDPHDPNHQSLEENFRQLCLWAETTLPRVIVHRLPIPPSRKIDGQRVPESYCNFLRLGSQRLLLPTFGAASDDRAIGILNELVAASIEPIDCRDLVWGLGALHCASREQPQV